MRFKEYIFVLLILLLSFSSCQRQQARFYSSKDSYFKHFKGNKEEILPSRNLASESKDSLFQTDFKSTSTALQQEEKAQSRMVSKETSKTKTTTALVFQESSSKTSSQFKRQKNRKWNTFEFKPDPRYLPQTEKSHLAAIFLCLFLGLLGIHRFYLGYKKEGRLFLFGTLGVYIGSILIALLLFNLLLGATTVFPLELTVLILLAITALYIWWLIDLIRIIFKHLKPKNGVYKP